MRADRPAKHAPREHLKGHLDLMLLALLDREPLHGYAVIAELRDRSDGTFDLPEGTVYPALHRLERAGLLRGQWLAGATRRRRVYSLTPAGAAVLGGQRSEWERFTRGVGLVLASA